MSAKGMLDPIIRALVGVNPKYHGVVLDLVRRLSGGETASLWHSRFAKALREKLPKGKPVVNHKFLRPVAQDVIGVFNPDVYKNNKDIWMSSEFSERILSLSVAEKFQPTEGFSPPSGFDIIVAANDEEIRSEFPKDHVYGASEFCWRLRKMTIAQPNGAKGDLLNGGYANIFYVAGIGGVVFAVHVYWYSDGRQWFFYCCRLGESRWDRGNRAFSRN